MAYCLKIKPKETKMYRRQIGSFLKTKIALLFMIYVLITGPQLWQPICTQTLLSLSVTMFLFNGNIHVYMYILISIDYLLYFHISYLQKNLGRGGGGGQAPPRPTPPPPPPPLPRPPPPPPPPPPPAPPPATGLHYSQFRLCMLFFILIYKLEYKQCFVLYKLHPNAISSFIHSFVRSFIIPVFPGGK